MDWSLALYLFLAFWAGAIPAAWVFFHKGYSEGWNDGSNTGD